MCSKELLEIRAIVKGTVQGVGFRHTTKLCAEELKLFGYVCNLPDGNVEIRAQGEKSVLKDFIEKLRQKFSGYIREIHCEFQVPVEIFADFKILRP